jgi:hypothetical protein
MSDQTIGPFDYTGKVARRLAEEHAAEINARRRDHVTSGRASRAARRCQSGILSRS